GGGQAARQDMGLVGVGGAGGGGRPDAPARQACAGDPARQEEDGAKQIEVERGGACRRGRGRGNRLRDGPREAARRWQRDGFGAWVAPIERRLVRPVESEPVAANTRRRVLRHIAVAPGGGGRIGGAAGGRGAAGG